MENEIYSIQDVVDIEEHNGRVWYQIKWENYPRKDNTWEPISNLIDCEDKIRQCEKKIVQRFNKQYKKMPPFGFEANRTGEKILDIFKYKGVQMVGFKFADSDRPDYVLLDEVKKMYPQMLLEFYLHLASE